MEIVFDLDTEAADLAKALGMTMVRAGTVGTHPAFIQMIGQLIKERRFAKRTQTGRGCLQPEPRFLSGRLLSPSSAKRR